MLTAERVKRSDKSIGKHIFSRLERTVTAIIHVQTASAVYIADRLQ